MTDPAAGRPGDLMTETNQRLAITVRCPYCGTDPGLCCRTDGDCPTTAHYDRLTLAKESR